MTVLYSKHPKKWEESYSHFADEKTEALSNQMTFPGHGVKAELRF